MPTVEEADRAPADRLVPRMHTAFDGIPYYDAELDVPQTTAHRIMVTELSALLAAIAQEADLRFLSDEPIWYIHPESEEQRAFYGDLVLARATDVSRITARDLLTVIEVVSTNDRRRALKDMRLRRALNEYNGVREFALAFPELEDPRALVFCRLPDGELEYEEHVVGPGGSVRSEAVPGLELRVLPREQWTAGYKLDVYFRGELRPRLLGERERAGRERERAERERERAERERERAERERERAERLAERLRALGVDPEGT
ncbi:MAG: Uma2 family endonuclease [Sandaracinaceae bacterium]|nr:Uma2 family endonuclease [Sandaracinaceae bacterium]